MKRRMYKAHSTLPTIHDKDETTTTNKRFCLLSTARRRQQRCFHCTPVAILLYFVCTKWMCVCLCVSMCNKCEHFHWEIPRESEKREKCQKPNRIHNDYMYSILGWFTIPKNMVFRNAYINKSCFENIRIGAVWVSMVACWQTWFSFCGETLRRVNHCITTYELRII